MKIDYDSFVVKKSDNFESMDFGIENDAIIFDILATKLYKNPLKILIQEYMCNARDSHRESLKSEIPIKIILPTPLNPYIQFIDYGVGISPERVSKVFVKLGNSTKSHNNIETGGFGIGAKTAWSYTDSFNIITTYDNVEYKYIAYLNNNIGKLDLLSKKEKKQSNGTIIKVKIQKKDFLKTAKNVFRTSFFWEVRPEIINIPDSVSFEDYNNVTYIDNKSAAIVHNQKYQGYLDCDDEKTVIVIDGIIYDDISNYTNNNKIKNKWGYSLYLFFNTGELFPVINRESVFNDNNTHTILNSKIDTICNNISKSINISNIEYFKDLYGVVKESNLEPFQIIRNIKLSNEFYSIYYEHNKLYIDLGDYEYYLIKYSFNASTNVMNSINVVDRIYITKSLLEDTIIINDKFTKTFNRTKIKQHCINNNIKYVSVITSSPDANRIKTDAILQLFKSLSSLDNVHSYLEMFNNTTVLSNSNNYYYKREQYLDKIIVEYCDINKLQNNYTHYILYKGKKDDICNYVELIEKYNKLTEDNIIILKYNKKQKSFLDNDKIITLNIFKDKARQYILNNISKLNFYYYLGINLLQEYEYLNSDRLKKIMKLREYTDQIENERFNKVITKYYEFSSKITNFQNIKFSAKVNTFYELFTKINSTNIPELDNKKKLIQRKLKNYNKEMELYFSKYPLLDYIRQYTSNENLTHFVNYINVLNEVKK